jgi:transposase
VGVLLFSLSVQAIGRELDIARNTVRKYLKMDDDAITQAQEDPGELRGVLMGGEERTVYFVVFVLACSQLMYVGQRLQPLDTEAFIQLHDESFRYFGGVGHQRSLL